MNFYNDSDPMTCRWVDELIEVGYVPDGFVSDKCIREVRADELQGYRQVHLFAGVCGWPRALRLAGWPASRPVWTGSCPCPPFSSAGKKKCKKCGGKVGFVGDEFGCLSCPWRDGRHLWPEMRRLIAACRPTVCFGEQVASADGRVWLSRVRADLEGLGYAVGAADLCAAGAGEEGEGWVVRGGVAAVEPLLVGAPHIRQRLFWGAVRLANAEGAGGWPDAGAVRGGPPARLRAAEGVDERRAGVEAGRTGDSSATGPTARGVVNADQSGREGRGVPGRGRADERTARPAGCPPAGRGFAAWSDFDALPCTDKKARRVERGTFPLVDGLPRGVVPGGDSRKTVTTQEAQSTAEARVMRLKAYGNAIVPQLAAIFVEEFMATIRELV